MMESGTIEQNLLGRVLTDGQTGLPSVGYFSLIRDWEERRALRRDYRVRVIRLLVTGGDERTRKSLGWRLCSEFRTSDLIASDGPGRYMLLLTSPDAEQAQAICDRIDQMQHSLNELLHLETALEFEVNLEDERLAEPCGPCQPCDTGAADVAESPATGLRSGVRERHRGRTGSAPARE